MFEPYQMTADLSKAEKNYMRSVLSFTFKYAFMILL